VVLLGAVAVLAVLAARADLTVLDLGVPATVADVTVGLAFAVAAVLSPVPAVQRLLLGGVGAAWLLASFLPVRSLHQALLVSVLVCFPAGRVPARLGWLPLAAAVPLAVGSYPQPVVALLLLVAGVVGTRTARSRYPVLAGGGVAAVLVVSWVLPRTFDAALGRLAYPAVLAAVAVGHVMASRAAATAAARRVENALGQVVALPQPGRLAALEPLLADALRDPALRVHAWGAGDETSLDEAGPPLAPDGVDRLVVADHTGPVAAVDCRPGVLADPATAAAVTTAVRLAAAEQRLQAEQQRELSELQAARRRLLEAADRQRESVAGRLRSDVLPALQAAVAQLPAGAPGGADDDPLRIVRDELDAASADVLGLVAGVPPEPLGDGRLAPALHALVRRCPVPVSLDIAPGLAAGAATETALYYVCSEALANVIKHARSTRVDLTLRGQEGQLEAIVQDDGRGGADPSGQGLRGLADRLATLDGALTVHSLPGRGTTVAARVPVSRSSSKA
jgi:signal transduction histidine kinase